MLRLLTAVFVAVALSSAAAAQSGPPESYRQFVGRLITEKGRCTAFPIHSGEIDSSPFGVHHEGSSYRVLFLTAGHCVSPVMHYEQPAVVVGYGAVSIRMSRSLILVRAVAVSPGLIGYDLAVLAAVMLYPLPALEVDMDYEPSPGEPLLQAGFGRGAWMVRVGPFVKWDEDGKLVVMATASPGNSGGPVIVPGTRKVIGVLVETSYPPDMLRSPLSCLMAACPPQPPYFVASVRRLPGLIVWPPK